LAFTLFVAGCSSMPLADSSRSIRELAEEHYPASCLLTPPSDYSKGEAEADAPLSKWALGSCWDSSLKCETFLTHLRWRAWFGKQFPGGTYPGPQITREQQVRLRHQSADSTICIRLEDPRLRDNESLIQDMQM
jgi:hypothetical protein